VKTVLKGTRSQDIHDIGKNIVTELIAVPLDTYSDCFVYLLERYKKYIAVTIHYLKEKSNIFLNFCVYVLCPVILVFDFMHSRPD